MLMAHCLLALIRPKLWLLLEIMQPTSDGVNSITVCQPIVMMFASPFQAELTSTIGPGSRNRRILETAKSRFEKAFIARPVINRAAESVDMLGVQSVYSQRICLFSCSTECPARAIEAQVGSG